MSSYLITPPQLTPFHARRFHPIPFQGTLFTIPVPKPLIYFVPPNTAVTKYPNLSPTFITLNFLILTTILSSPLIIISSPLSCFIIVLILPPSLRLFCAIFYITKPPLLPQDALVIKHLIISPIIPKLNMLRTTIIPLLAIALLLFIFHLLPIALFFSLTLFP